MAKKQLSELELIVNEVFSSAFNFLDPLPERPDYLLEIENGSGNLVGIADEGSLVILSGPQKSMKSSFMGAMAAAMLSPSEEKVMNFVTRPSEGLILWFDTEQSRREFSMSQRRIGLMAGFKKHNRRFWSFPLRKYPGDQFEIMKQITHHLASKAKIDAIFGDGIADLYSSYKGRADENDQVDTFWKEIMAMADTYNCPFFTTIHTNKTNPNHTAGSLGSSGDKKASYHIRLDKIDKISKVNTYDSRDGEIFDPFCIKFEDGLLTVTEDMGNFISIDNNPMMNPVSQMDEGELKNVYIEQLGAIENI